MNRYIRLFAYLSVAAFLLSLGAASTIVVFKTDGFGAGMMSVVAWIVALVMLWFLGPQRQSDGSFI